MIEAGDIVDRVLSLLPRYERERLVARLRAARERKKALTGKCGGRKSYAELDAAVVALAKEISRGERIMSLREIAAKLASLGHTPKRGAGRPFSASAIRSMLGANFKKRAAGQCQ
jgi:DNA invertase Pin-like site-specific DNA recombinase